MPLLIPWAIPDFKYIIPDVFGVLFEQYLRQKEDVFLQLLWQNDTNRKYHGWGLSTEVFISYAYI